MDQDSELALVSGLKAGDPAAFDAVHAAFNVPLFSFLVRLSRRREVAEDLLEETWLRLVSHAARLRPDTRLAPWLFTVARNLYVSYQRSRQLEDTHAASLIGLWPCGLSGPSPFEATIASEMERRIEAALVSLPATYREVMMLVGVHGFTRVEAAEICGISPEALRQRLSRARALLASKLDGSERAHVSVLSGVTP
jgi:RNA polymerase sigma-70 factor (ECF subfamily)